MVDESTNSRGVSIDIIMIPHPLLMTEIRLSERREHGAAGQTVGVAEVCAVVVCHLSALGIMFSSVADPFLSGLLIALPASSTTECDHPHGRPGRSLVESHDDSVHATHFEMAP